MLLLVLSLARFQLLFKIVDRADLGFKLVFEVNRRRLQLVSYLAQFVLQVYLILLACFLTFLQFKSLFISC